MSVDKAAEIIRRAMAERTVYDAMAARENEVWGKILPERESSETAIEDTKAAAMLGFNRNWSSLPQLASEKGLTFEHGLTLGCGAGRCERDLISRGVCRSFHGIDISEHAVAKARETAKEQGLPLTYDVADLNFVKLPEKTFDLVVAQTCLHHILFLEHVADQIWRSLKSDGYLWIHDFIGETQFQYDDRSWLFFPKNSAKTQLPAGQSRRSNVPNPAVLAHRSNRSARPKSSRYFNGGLRLNGSWSSTPFCALLYRRVLVRPI
jgi:SAM-dependent methyltransferase